MKRHHDTPSGDSYNRLQSLMQLTALINSSLDPLEVRQMAIETIPHCVSADVASLLLIDSETGELYFEVASGENSETLKTIRLKPGEGIAGWVARRGGAIIIDDVKSDKRFASTVDNTTGYQTRNMIVAPVATKDKLWGVLQVINKLAGDFNEDDLDLVRALANQVAIAIENASIYQELRSTFLGVTTALAEALEKRDAYTAGHTQRVHEYSLAIARRLHLSDEQLDNLRLAAILHDIGKIGVSDQVLRKPGRLDPDEFEEMSRHPASGSEILQHLPQLAEVRPGVLYHHEQYNGKGYPSRLQGEAIPLFARIIAVADAFDAMTSNRPYRTALAVDTALAELKRCRGEQFDPGSVDAFMAAWQAGEISLEQTGRTN